MFRGLFIFLIVAFVWAEDFPATNLRYVLIQSGILNVRDKPVDGKVITKLNAGDKVTVLENVESNYGWKKIKTASNVIGYVSDEFLGFYSISEIQKGKLIGIVGAGDSADTMKKGALRILGGSFSGKWYGYDGNGDFSYFLNYLVKNKKSLDILENNLKVGTFKAESIAKYGCQEFKGIQGTAFPKQITSSNEILYLGTTGILESNLKFTLSEKVTEIHLTNLLNEATKLFKNNKVTPKELENLSEKKVIQINSGNGKSLLVARYAIKNEHAEKHYVSLVAEILKNDKLKIIHKKFESLEEERGNYGGSFHFMGAIDVDGKGTPAIIFIHIGFDSTIYELFQIKENSIESLFVGGGDAC